MSYLNGYLFLPIQPDAPASTPAASKKKKAPKKAAKSGGGGSNVFDQFSQKQVIPFWRHLYTVRRG